MRLAKKSGKGKAPRSAAAAACWDDDKPDGADTKLAIGSGKQLLRVRRRAYDGCCRLQVGPGAQAEPGSHDGLVNGAGALARVICSAGALERR